MQLILQAGFAATRYFCRTADDWLWWGGADSEQRAEHATAAMWCQAGGGGGLLSHCPKLWPQLQPPVQPPAAHAQKHFSHCTGRPGRESGTTTFVEYDLGLSRRECSCYVRNSATVQLPRAGIPALHCCLAQLHLLLLHGVLNWSFCNVKMSTAWGRNPSGDIGQSLSGGHHGDQTLLFSDAAGQLLDHMAQSFDDGLTRKR